MLEHQQVNNYWCNFLIAVLQQVAASLLQVSFVSIMGVRAFNRVIWVCFQMVRLATFIAGKIVAVDVSVFMHAILSDEIVSQVAQGTTSIYAEVFVFMNLWYINKCMGEAMWLIFVFDGDPGLRDHCPTCASKAKSRLGEKDAVAGAQRTAARQLAAKRFQEVVAAANKAVHDGDLVDDKFLEAKREELDTLAKKAHSRSIAVRTAMLFWIVQHNNHLRRDIDGVGGTAVGKASKKPNVARTTDEEKRRGNKYDVKRKPA